MSVLLIAGSPSERSRTAALLDATGDRVVVMEPSPGRIRRTIAVDLPHPRDRASYAFAQVKDRVLAEFAEHTSAELAEPPLREPLPAQAAIASWQFAV